ncbi:MAG: AAA family ATPase [Pseudonocardiaceae bacterium]
MLRRYVLMGAPGAGAGKTVIGLALRDRGYAVVAEAATDVIAEEQARGVEEPWRSESFLDDTVRLQHQRQTEPIPSHVGVPPVGRVSSRRVEARNVLEQIDRLGPVTSRDQFPPPALECLGISGLRT